MASAGPLLSPFPGPTTKTLNKVLTREKHDQNDNNTPASRKILDRWASLQARQMIHTIERRAHDAELSALSTTTQPVSARAATFLRETSPSSTSESSSLGNVEVKSNVRASSLIQMWREMEAESGVPAVTTRVGDERRMMRSFSEKGGMIRVRCRREIEDLVERMMKERKKEVGEIKEMKRVSKFSHRGRIQVKCS